MITCNSRMVDLKLYTTFSPKPIDFLVRLIRARQISKNNLVITTSLKTICEFVLC